jgi:predicted nucleic acid-binding protein
MVIVDTSVWIDYFNGVENAESNWLEWHVDEQRLGLTTIILTEILQGLGDEKTAAMVEAELRQFEIFEGLSRRLAVQAAKNYRKLRRNGKTPRKTIDVLIATFCIEEQHSLLHRDRDFDPFEELLGLSVIHP